LSEEFIEVASATPPKVVEDEFFCMTFSSSYLKKWIK
jgi:hypothetical protein